METSITILTYCFLFYPQLVLFVVFLLLTWQSNEYKKCKTVNKKGELKNLYKKPRDKNSSWTRLLLIMYAQDLYSVTRLTPLIAYNAYNHINELDCVVEAGQFFHNLRGGGLMHHLRLLFQMLCRMVSPFIYRVRLCTRLVGPHVSPTICIEWQQWHLRNEMKRTNRV